MARMSGVIASLRVGGGAGARTVALRDCGVMMGGDAGAWTVALSGCGAGTGREVVELS